MRIRGRLRREQAQGRRRLTARSRATTSRSTQVSSQASSPPRVAQGHRPDLLAPRRRRAAPGRPRVAGLAHADDRRAGGHGRRRRRGRLAARRLDEQPPDSASLGAVFIMLGLIAIGRRPVPDGGRGHHLRGERHQRPAERRPDHASGLARRRRHRSVDRGGGEQERGRFGQRFVLAAQGRHRATGISALSGLAFFLALTILSLFFLLSDGPEDPPLGRRALRRAAARSPTSSASARSARCAAISSASPLSRDSTRRS